jgi:hypothetical protein
VILHASGVDIHNGVEVPGPVDDGQYDEAEYRVTKIYADVKAPGLLDLAVTYCDSEGEWTETGIYSGDFEVWWLEQ